MKLSKNSTVLSLLLLVSAAVLSGATSATAQTSLLVPSARLDRAQAFQDSATPSLEMQMGLVEPKSKYKAALFSALLPGMGEAYAGHKGRAIAFGVAELGIWATYAVFKIQEDVRHDRAIEFAIASANANSGGTDEYYKSVGRFLRSDGPGMWNEFVRRRQRDTGEVLGPEYSGADAWAWTSQANLRSYRSLREGEIRAEENATNMFAFAILNRVLSVIDAVYIVSKDNRALEDGGFGLKLDTGGSTMARVMLQNRF